MIKLHLDDTLYKSIEYSIDGDKQLTVCSNQTCLVTLKALDGQSFHEAEALLIFDPDYQRDST